MSVRAQTSRVVDFPGAGARGLGIGDVVRTGENRYPHYEVIAISGERAWIRDIQYGDDHIVPIAGLRTISS